MSGFAPCARRLVAVALSAVLASAVACSSTPAADGTRDASNVASDRIPVTIETESGPVVFQAEIADTPAERARGLMWRKSMGESEGMLFLFAEEEAQSFWMHNTLIPLDMIFIRGDRTILGIYENATPKTDTLRNVPGVSQFVLEVNGGLSAAKGLKAGQKVVFFAPVPKE